MLGEIRSLFADTFMTFPLLLLGFIFFFGTLTSNVGLLYLLIGHFIVVPSLSFLSDPDSNPFTVDGGIKYFDGIQSIASLCIVLWINAHALGGGYNYLLFLLAIVPYLGNAFGGNKSVMYYYNPVGWFRSAATNDEDPEIRKNISPNCGMIPSGGSPRNNPSTWVSHLVFFYGFVFANALAIMNEPPPVLYDTMSPESQKTQANINARVNNRKNRTILVMVFSSIAIAAMLGLRYMTSYCEGSFFYNIAAIIITGLTGAAWFQLLYIDCGVRPADILGIVQGMVSPRMADNPIVCVGT